MRTPLVDIALAMELYHDGVSIRKTRRLLRKAGRIPRHHSTVLRWLTKYPGVVQPFLDQFPGKMSPVWSADETAVWCRRGDGPLVQHWLWLCMDKGTRYVLASQLTDKRRTLHRATALFKQAQGRSQWRPKVIQTDGLQAYPRGVRKVFWHPLPRLRVEHERVKAMGSNALMERVNQTYKERYKVKRGYKSLESAAALSQGFWIGYNYLRKHMTLEMTPAEAAGIRFPFEDGWGDLIQWGTRYQTLVHHT